MLLKKRTSASMPVKRTTVNLPAELLAEATRVTGKGITETIVAGLTLVKRSAAFEKAQRLRGKLNLEIDLDVSRERPRR